MRLAAAGTLSAAIPVLWVWGFTVDDALISARVAYHLGSGRGYRFNPSGPMVDAVTPLGFAHLLAPFATDGPLAAHRASKLIGVVSYLTAVALLWLWVARRGGSRLRFVPLTLLPVSLPLAAWAVSGMETGLVVLLATLALSSRPIAALAAGIAAALRPELIPWAVVLACSASFARNEGLPGFLRALGLAFGPAAAIMLIRLVAFGSAAPLSVYAKPADTAHGLFYATAALIWSGAPVLAAAPGSFAALSRHERGVLVACGVHWISVLGVGGDWMPFFRLCVPVLPALLWVACAVAAKARPPWTALRAVLALVPSTLLFVRESPAARHIEAQRAALIETVGPLLRGARRVAAVDVGWVGAATPGNVADLAGVTDPSVAILPGGHTSKRIPDDWLDRREVDALVLLVESAAAEPGYLREASFVYSVDRRIAQLSAELPFARVASVPLRGTHRKYLVLRRQGGL